MQSGEEGRHKRLTDPHGDSAANTKQQDKQPGSSSDSLWVNCWRRWSLRRPNHRSSNKECPIIEWEDHDGRPL